jgi:CAP-Gly domain-containing linker protein 1
MTAQQLSSRDRNDRAESPVVSGGENLNSPTLPAMQRTIPSPTYQPGSPFSTPKAGLGRLSLVKNSSPARSQLTSRVRIPSSVSMPPPPSPKHLLNRAPGTEEDSPKKLDIHDTLIVKEKLPTFTSSSSRPASSTSFRSTGTDDLNLIEQLQSRLDAVEYENERLRTSSEVDVGGQLKALQSERQEIIDRSLRLEGEISLLESKLAAHASQIETFHTEKESLTAQVTISQGEALASRLARQQDAIQLKTLREEIDSYGRANSEKDNIIKSNALVIEQLSADFERVCRDFEEERKELGIQIDELRTAGQVSLYTYGCIQ